MRISMSWLSEWVDAGMDTAALASRLTMSGIEVESIEPAAGDFQGVVVGEVLSVEQHPGADKLTVCQVAAGGAANLQIVCGAPNVRAGMKAPLALEGAKLAAGEVIRKAKAPRRRVVGHAVLGTRARAVRRARRHPRAAGRAA